MANQSSGGRRVAEKPARRESAAATAFKVPANYCNAIHTASQGPILRITFGDGTPDSGPQWHSAVAIHAKVAEGLIETLQKFIEEDAEDEFGEPGD